MILEIDMGNTRLKWRLKSQLTRLAAGSIPSGAGYDALGDIVAEYKDEISRILVVSVQSSDAERELSEWAMLNIGCAPEFAYSSAICGLVSSGYSDPSLLGVDRWLAVVAGYHEIRSACVVVSAGTALTVDLVAEDGRHLGGYIAPGISLFGAALSNSTARIKLGNNKLSLALSPGDSTATAVANACAAMIVGVIENALQQIKLLSEHEKIYLLVTGGDAELIKDLYPWAEYKQELVLDGLSYNVGFRSINNGEGR